MEKKYVRTTVGLKDRGQLIPAEELDSTYTSEKDEYASLYYYNEEQFKKFQETGTIAGITDVVTDRVVFDFDCKDDLTRAHEDAVKLMHRLEKFNIKKEDVEVYFSGNKGFTVEFKIDKLIQPDQVKHLAMNVFGKDLETLDPSIYNAARVIRRANTKHPETGLYKHYVGYGSLVSKYCLTDLKTNGLKPGRAPKQLNPVAIPDTLFNIPKEKPKVNVTVMGELKEVMESRPKHWKDYKWALVQAVGLQRGERTEAMKVIASTCRGLGYPEDITRRFLESFDEKYALVTQQDLDPTKIEGWLKSVYSDNWLGGMSSPKNNPWLHKYIERIGLTVDESDNFVSISDIAKDFHDFSTNFEKNLVKTGIEMLDKNALFLTSTHNGLLGQPGSGKTSFLLQWLRYCSEQNMPSLFYSLDMARPIIYGKMVQQEAGKGFAEAIKEYNTSRIDAAGTDIAIHNRYKNVDFNFGSAVTVNQIKDDVKRWEDKHGKKVRLLGIDYLECLAGPYSDATANTGYISNQLKDLANELAVCSVILLQTQKHSTPDISDPLHSMKQVKGSSIIEQSASVLLSLWREGYNPSTTQDDKYISFSVIKNRFGELWTGDFSWNGRNGIIAELTGDGQKELTDFRKKKKENRIEQHKEKNGLNNGWE